MKFAILAMLIVLAGLSTAACTGTAKLNSTMVSCLQGGQNAIYFLDGACEAVACGPKTPDVVGVCLQSDTLTKGVQNCLASGLEADVFGNVSCMDVRCGARGLRGGQNATNSSSIIDVAIYYGTKYSTALGVAGTALVAVGGWYLATRKKNKMSQYLTKIDEIYSSYHENAKECEAELRKMKKAITEELRKGNLDEGTFGIVEKRLDDCIAEIRDLAAKERQAKKEV